MKTMIATVMVLAVCGLAGGVSPRSRVRIGVDGGYSDIVVKISPQTPFKHCRTIISNLQVYYRWLFYYDYLKTSRVI